MGQEAGTVHPGACLGVAFPQRPGWGLAAVFVGTANTKQVPGWGRGGIAGSSQIQVAEMGKSWLCEPRQVS